MFKYNNFKIRNNQFNFTQNLLIKIPSLHNEINSKTHFKICIPNSFFFFFFNRYYQFSINI